jgi:hypothetical protein
MTDTQNDLSAHARRGLMNIGRNFFRKSLPYSGKFFCGAQFSRMQSFRSLIFADARDHAHYTLYHRTYFTCLIFMDSRLSTKIGPHENFLLYDSLIAMLYT